MVILAIDTSGKRGGVALARGHAAGFTVIGERSIESGWYSARLMPSITELLRDADVHKEQLEGFVVASGPGAFTGLRVGIATVKALAEALRRPLAAISALELVASKALRPGERVVAALDAGRKEVYAGLYAASAEQEWPTCNTEFLASLDELKRWVETNCPDAAVVTPDEAIVTAMRGLGSATQVPYPGAADLAAAGWRRLRAGITAPVAELDANYIRRSDAEIFSLTAGPPRPGVPSR
ncbi:MAG: tRNA (adenosine(37)-N6)-threonylcarbamoyltransferase complex dimerization subunit type 1 TsaB [Acidobacteria bacterium]|nr:tRNA (adenosine(37)-N6)-threonylcarbamoyltransferase complex dimerization subunit type 1 TsaB [Acidobacteriota bacterium]